MDDLARSKLRTWPRVRSHILTQPLIEGNSWLLPNLSPTQVKRLKNSQPMVGTESGEMDAVDSKLILALWADARASVIDLAATTNLSSSVTRRRLQRLLDSGQAILRCDFNRQLVGWPVTILYFATIAPDHLAATQRLLRKLPEVHTSIHTAGPHNLVIDVCLRSLTDCSVSLCFVKYLGRLVDEKGNCVGSVPMDIS